MFRLKSLIAILLVVSILFIFAVATQVFMGDFIQTNSLFVYMLFSSVVTGLISSILIEKIDVKILA